MRKFTCFLFENFDPDREAENPTNPRRVLNASADAVLSRVAEFPPLGCPADGLRREFGSGVERLIAASAERASIKYKQVEYMGDHLGVPLAEPRS